MNIPSHNPQKFCLCKCALGTSICIINKDSLQALLKHIITNYLERDAEVLLSFLPVEASWVSLLPRNKCKQLAGDWRKVFFWNLESRHSGPQRKNLFNLVLFSRTQQLISSALNKTFWTLSLLIPHHLHSVARYKWGFESVYKISIYSHFLFSD